MHIGRRCSTQHVAQGSLGIVGAHDIAIWRGYIEATKSVQLIGRRLRDDAHFLRGRRIVASRKAHRERFGSGIGQPQQIQRRVVREKSSCEPMLSRDVLVLPSFGRAIQSAIDFDELTAGYRSRQLSIPYSTGRHIRSGNKPCVFDRYVHDCLRAIPPFTCYKLLDIVACKS